MSLFRKKAQTLPVKSDLLASDIWVRPKKKTPSNIFYDELKPVLHTLRVLAKFSYEITKEGDMVVRLNSFWSLYTFLVYCIQSFIAVENIQRTRAVVETSTGTIQDILLAFNSFIYVGFHFIIPILVWIEWRKIAEYFNNWKSFQATYKQTTGKRIPIHLKRFAFLWVVTLVPIVSILTYLVADLMYIVDVYHLAPYVSVFLYFNLYLFMWILTCVAVGRISVSITKEIHKVVTGPCHGAKADILYKYRALWINLNKVASKMGDSLSASISLIMISNSLCFICCSYVILSSLVAKRFDFIAFLVIMIIDFAYLSVLIESAHWASKKLGRDFIRAVSSHNTYPLDQRAAFELNLIATAVKVSSPAIRLAGVLTIDRGVLIALASNTVTYLIVLIQFEASEIKN